MSVRAPLALLGAGSWGTALALLLARNDQDVLLWSYDRTHVEEMRNERVNRRYLPHYPFPQNIQVSHDLNACLTNTLDIMMVIPSFAFQDVLKQMKSHFTSQHRIAWGTKGLSSDCRLLHEVIVDVLESTPPMAVLSGPSLALEVAADLPTAVALASNDDLFARDLIKRLATPRFRIYQNTDMIGTELCGAVKNVLAIATGIGDGLQLGSNARAALITRGLAEMKRLCAAMGGQVETPHGLAGLGDLVLTCTDNKSRNRRFGLALGRGLSREEAETEIGQVVEGAYNVEQIEHLSREHAIAMPITERVYRILNEALDPHEAVLELLSRELKSE